MHVRINVAPPRSGPSLRWTFTVELHAFALAISLLALASLLLGRLEIILGYGGCSEHVSEGLVQKVIDANGTIQFLICDDRCVVVENAFLPVNLDLRILVSTLQGLAVGVAGLVQRPLGFHNNPRQLLATVNRGTVQILLLWFVRGAKKALRESVSIIGGLEDELRVVGRQLIVCVGICGNLFVCCLQ